MKDRGNADLEPGLERFKHDLHSGRWHDQHADLLDLDALDLGYCIVTAEL